MIVSRGDCLVRRRNGDVRVDATMEDDGFDRTVTASGVRSLLDRAIDV